MNCVPRCDLPLPEIGAARVSTNFDVCTDPAELSIRVIHEVRSISTFLVGDHSVDSRNIGTEHWPLKLNVQLYENLPDQYYAKACIITERTGQITCFMNSTFSKETLMSDCDSTKLGVSSSLAIILLTVVMIVFFVTAGVGVVFFVHHVFVKISRSSRQTNKLHKQHQCTTLLPSIQRKKMSNEENRLTVIEEEKEELSRISQSQSSSEFEGDAKGLVFGSHEHRSLQLDTVASIPSSTLHTFRTGPQLL